MPRLPYPLARTGSRRSSRGASTAQPAKRLAACAIVPVGHAHHPVLLDVPDETTGRRTQKLVQPLGFGVILVRGSGDRDGLVADRHQETLAPAPTAADLGDVIHVGLRDIQHVGTDLVVILHDRQEFTAAVIPGIQAQSVSQSELAGVTRFEELAHSAGEIIIPDCVTSMLAAIAKGRYFFS
jgi:hypothetical protein